jgi:hypothetical protein
MAWPGHPEAMKIEPSLTLFSHQCPEEVFLEVRQEIHRKIVHSRDVPILTRLLSYLR